MSNKVYVCPKCQLQVKDLKGHTARIHDKKPARIPRESESEAPQGQLNSAPEQVARPAARRLELEKPVAAPRTKEETPAGYHCVDCGGSISKGQANCPGCDCALDWGAV